MPPILNARDIPLNQIAGSVPNVSGAMLDWFQPILFSQVKKEIINFQVSETTVDINFQGVWQPFSAQQLAMKPESQQTWKWFTLHSQTTLSLIPDDVITYQATQYRVMQKMDYSLYGYYEYHIIQDFKGSGPDA